MTKEEMLEILERREQEIKEQLKKDTEYHNYLVNNRPMTPGGIFNWQYDVATLEDNNRMNKLRLRLIEALKKSANYPFRNSNYLDFSMDQRLNGINGAGSWYENLSKEELLEKLTTKPIGDDTNRLPDDAKREGCTYLSVNVPGKNGIRSIDELPEDSDLYLSVLHKGTGYFSVATTKKVPAVDESATTIILENEPDVGEMVSTFHPGLPVASSKLDINGLLKMYPEFSKALEGKEGQNVILQITREQAKSLGFDMAKLTSDDKAKELEEAKIDVRDVKKEGITLAEVRDREKNNEH